MLNGHRIKPSASVGGGQGSGAQAPDLFRCLAGAVLGVVLGIPTAGAILLIGYAVFHVTFGAPSP